MYRFWMLAALAAVLGTAAVADGMEAFVYGGRTLVPLRTVSESFGASVQYDSRTKGVSISLDYRKVDMTVDSPRAHVGDRVVVLDSSPVMVAGVCYVPARFVSETFGFSITWVSTERRVIVINPKTKKRIVLVASRHVPPGLAKKHGVPPGLAKKGGMPPGQAKKHGDARNKDDGKGHGKHKGGG